jgi:hypothetical protein
VYDQDAALQRLSLMIKEETDVDRIQRLLIILAGRFSFNGDSVGRRGGPCMRPSRGAY